MLLSVFVFQSCEKENIETNDIDPVLVSEEASARNSVYSENYSANFLREMTLSHLRYDANRDPFLYFPGKIREEFSQQYNAQKIELESLGRSAYIEARKEEGTMTPYFANAILALDPIIVKVNNGKYEEAIDDLIAQRPNAEIPSDEAIGVISIYDILIAQIENAINNEDQATLREPCSLGEFIDDVVDGVTIGLAVGAAIQEVLTFLAIGNGPIEVVIQGITFSLPLIGAIVGGIVGAIGSLFSDGNCDCGPATSIRVVILNDNGDICNPSYRLQAFGAGDDAELFNWNVNEGNSGAFYPAEPARLSVTPTQNSPNIPLEVSTTTLCANDLDDETAMLANVFSESPINLFDSYAQVEEVGDILLFGQFDQQADGTVEITQGGEAPIVRPSSTNGGTLRNTFTIQFISGFGSTTTTGEDEFRLFISGNVGDEGSFRVRGTNNCSGAVSDLVLNYVIVQ